MKSMADPIVSKERIDSIDVLRGVAVLGILTINISMFGLPYAAGVNPSLVGVFEGLDVLVFQIMWVGFEGSQRAIFSMLFGAGVVLLTSRLEAAESPVKVAGVYYRRTILLMLFGLIDAYLLLWYGDILFLYGVAGLLLYPLRRVRPSRLLALGVVVLAFIALQNILVGIAVSNFGQAAREAQELAASGSEVSADQQELIDMMAGLPGFEPPAEQIEAEIEARSAGYVPAFWQNLPHAYEFQVTLALLRLLWDALGLMLVGMALYAWRVFDASRSVRFYATMAAVGLVIGLSVNSWETQRSLNNDFEPMVLYWTYDIGRLATALGYIGLVMLGCKSGLFARARQVLAATGRMALTNYILQTLLCNLIFIGLGLFGQFRLHQLALVTLAIWAFELAFSPWWLSRYRFGPLEWLWRSLTYGKRQRLRIAVASAG